MNASHASLRDDYEVSVAALDQLVALLQEHAAVFGAKLTGAGFGGACVAVVESSCLGEVANTTLRRFAATGGRGALLAPRSLELDLGVQRIECSVRRRHE